MLFKSEIHNMWNFTVQDEKTSLSCCHHLGATQNLKKKKKNTPANLTSFPSVSIDPASYLFFILFTLLHSESLTLVWQYFLAQTLSNVLQSLIFGESL